MGTTELDSRGRITIPKELRDRLHIEPGDEMSVDLVDGEIRLRVEREGLTTADRDDEWGEEAFLDAGEATFHG